MIANLIISATHIRQCYSCDGVLDPEYSMVIEMQVNETESYTMCRDCTIDLMGQLKRIIEIQHKVKKSEIRNIEID